MSTSPVSDEIPPSLVKAETKSRKLLDKVLKIEADLRNANHELWVAQNHEARERALFVNKGRCRPQR